MQYSTAYSCIVVRVIVSGSQLLYQSKNYCIGKSKNCFFKENILLPCKLLHTFGCISFYCNADVQNFSVLLVDILKRKNMCSFC